MVNIVDEIIWENKFFGKGSIVLTLLIAIVITYVNYFDTKSEFAAYIIFGLILLNIGLIIKRTLFTIKTNEYYFAIKRFAKWKKIEWNKLYSYNIIYKTLYLETDDYEILIPLDYLRNSAEFVYCLKEHILQKQKI